VTRVTSRGGRIGRARGGRCRRRDSAGPAASPDVAAHEPTADAGRSRSRGRQSWFRFGASQPRALPGAENAFDVGEARRAIARARGGRRGRRDPAPANSHESPSRVAQRRGSAGHDQIGTRGQLVIARQRKATRIDWRAATARPESHAAARPRRARLAGAASAFTSARRAVARARGRRGRRRNSAAADSHEKPGRVARRRGS
jgi:hypothetical protein